MRRQIPSEDPYLEYKIMDQLSKGIYYYKTIADRIGAHPTTVNSSLSKLKYQGIVQKKRSNQGVLENISGSKRFGLYEMTKNGIAFFNFLNDHRNLNIQLHLLDRDSLETLPNELQDWFENSRRLIRETTPFQEGSLEAGFQHQTILHPLVLKSIPNYQDVLKINQHSHHTSSEELSKLMNEVDIGFLNLSTASELVKSEKQKLYQLVVFGWVDAPIIISSIGKLGEHDIFYLKNTKSRKGTAEENARGKKIAPIEAPEDLHKGHITGDYGTIITQPPFNPFLKELGKNITRTASSKHQITFLVCNKNALQKRKFAHIYNSLPQIKDNLTKLPHQYKFVKDYLNSIFLKDFEEFRMTDPYRKFQELSSKFQDYNKKLGKGVL